jgi:hypothetical protein
LRSTAGRLSRDILPTPDRGTLLNLHLALDLVGKNRDSAERTDLENQIEKYSRDAIPQGNTSRRRELENER